MKLTIIKISTQQTSHHNITTYCDFYSESLASFTNGSERVGIPGTCVMIRSNSANTHMIYVLISGKRHTLM